MRYDAQEVMEERTEGPEWYPGHFHAPYDPVFGDSTVIVPQ